MTNWSQFTQEFGDFIEGSYLAHAVYGYFLNGGGACYVVRIGADGAMPAAQAELKSAQAKDVAGYRIRAIDPGPDGNDLTVEVSEPTLPTENAFKLVVKRDGKVEETFDNVTTSKGKQNVVTIVKAQSKLIQIEEVGNVAVAERVPAAGRNRAGRRRRQLARSRQSGRLCRQLGRPDRFRGPRSGRRRHDARCPGLDGRLSAGRHRPRGGPGGPARDDRPLRADGRSGRDPRLAARPQCPADQGMAGRQGRLRLEVRHALLAVVQGLRPPERLRGLRAAERPHGRLSGRATTTAAGSTRRPPTRSCAARSRSSSRSPRPSTTQLNPVGINCIRAFPGRGIRIWGARTLSSDPAWRYLNVRRLFNYVEESILEGTQWVVFEPNDLRLWQRVKRTINAFLLRTWRDGALFGATPEEAFYVKCDAETNPPEVIDAGQLVVEIGIAPVKPAEFVIFRIAQFSGGAAVSE